VPVAHLRLLATSRGHAGRTSSPTTPAGLPALARFSCLTGGSRRALEKELDELGNQGFELAWVLPEMALQKEKDGHVLIFKRPKPAA
jgi:hypothetical protein